MHKDSRLLFVREFPENSLSLNLFYNLGNLGNIPTEMTRIALIQSFLISGIVPELPKIFPAEFYRLAIPLIFSGQINQN